MARTWLTIRVDLVSGRGEELWPRPGRLFLARRSTTFRQFAEAINTAFARWDLAHLHHFMLADGTQILPLAWWEEAPVDALDDVRTALSRLSLDETFAYEFDLGDGWEHVCTVGPQRVDPYEVYGGEPDRPVPIFGWGSLPDQYGREWDGDDGESPPPPAPDPPFSDLPPLMPYWGEQAPASARDLGGLLPRLEWDDAAYGALRGAVYRHDGEAVMDLLSRREPFEAAQLAGDGLRHALHDRRPGAALLSRRLIEDLRGRALAGDLDLADQLETALGDAPSGDLACVPVNLDELASLLEGDEWPDGMRLHLESGQFWPEDVVAMTGGPEPDDWDDPDRWLSVTSLGSREAWEDMREFIGEVDDGDLADRLERAIDGRGPFRAFRNTLSEHPELVEAWRRFADERRRGRARSWLAVHGYRPC